MYHQEQSPFEQYRLKRLNGIAMSADLFKMIAEAFEAGQMAERKACAKVAEKFDAITGLKSASAIRSRGNNEIG